MKLLGSHNSMSYLRPERAWMWLLRPFGRCQRLTLREQIAAGCRVFDLRIVWRDGRWRFAHGLMRVRGLHLFEVLSQLPAGSVVRLILERGKLGITFEQVCRRAERAYPELTFIGGRRKCDWVQVYRFRGEREYPESMVHQHVGSVAPDARWYEKIIPWLYARRRGRYAEPEEGVNLYDFVECRV